MLDAPLSPSAATAGCPDGEGLISDERPVGSPPARANMMDMTAQPHRSRLLLMPAVRPAGAQTARPKVRRYQLVRLRVDARPGARSGDVEDPGRARR
jgi:hypothetical protein